MIKKSVRGGDAASYRITLTTCYYSCVVMYRACMCFSLICVDGVSLLMCQNLYQFAWTKTGILLTEGIAAVDHHHQEWIADLVLIIVMKLLGRERNGTVTAGEQHI